MYTRHIQRFVSALARAGIQWCPYASECTASSNTKRLSSMHDRHVLVISRVVRTCRLDLNDLSLHFVEL